MSWQDRDYYRDDTQPMRLGPRGLSVTMWLIIINGVIFVLDGIITGSQRGAGISPSWWGNFNIPQAIYGLQLWRVVSYQFLHANILHIFFNMLALYYFGPLAEGWWGARRYLAFYLLCGISGAVVFTILSLSGIVPGWGRSYLVGASGAIFGILITGALVAPDMRVMLLIPPIPLRLRTLAWVYLAIVVGSILFGTQNAGGEAAHLGGAALGFLLVKNPWLLNWAQGSGRRSRSRQFWQPGGGGGNSAFRDESDPKALDSARARGFGVAEDDASGGEDGGGGSRGIVQRLHRWQEEKKTKERAQREAEVDRILAKVKEEGLHSLTAQEQATLRQATEERRS